MIEKEEWSEVSVPDNAEENEVAYEIEESSEQAIAVSAPEEKEEKEKEKGGSELDGVETSGAQKRIRQLIRQRKERDEQIHSLMQKNEELETNLKTKHSEVQEINKLSLDASEKQLTEWKIETLSYPTK